jgi:hypothetical protein
MDNNQNFDVIYNGENYLILKCQEKKNYSVIFHDNKPDIISKCLWLSLVFVYWLMIIYIIMLH